MRGLAQARASNGRRRALRADGLSWPGRWGCAIVALLLLSCPGPSTLGGTSTGGPPPAVDAGECLTDGGSPEGSACEGGQVCSCPSRCGLDPLLAVPADGVSGLSCLAPCAATSDCLDPTRRCSGGLCLPNVCAADGGPLDGPCKAAGLADGTCLPARTASGAPIGLCQQAGSAADTCQPGADRSQPAGLCGVGSVCVPLLGGARCESVCDPLLAGDQCGLAALCLPLGSNEHAGACAPLGDGGCLLAPPMATALLPCASAAACGCPQRCAPDPGSAQSLCQGPCTETAECASALTRCQAGLCAPAYCGVDALGAQAPGSLGAPCLGGDGGICAPFPSNQTDSAGNPLFAYGLCVQSGSAALGQACDLASGRASPSLLCAASSYCLTNQALDQSTCQQACDPTLLLSPDAGGCGATQGCFALFGGTTPALAPHAGACQACALAGRPCTSGAECCTRLCGDAGPSETLCE